MKGMNYTLKFKQITLLAGDIAILYLSLLVTLFFRYGDITSEILAAHLMPFTIIFAFWILIFYIAGLYDLRALGDMEFSAKFLSALAISTLFAIVIFYLIPIFVITPKTNLLIFAVIFGLIGYLWRNLYNSFSRTGSPANKILLIGYNQTAQELTDHISKNPQLGYEIKFWMKEGLQDKELDHLAQIILANKINIVVVPAHIKKDSKAARLIYKNLVLGIEVINLADLYEAVFQKIPLAELEEVWFLENLAKKHRTYQILKRPIEITFAILVAIITLPIAAIVALLIKLTSPKGPIIFSQTRTGKNDKEFTIYKFRSMRIDAEKHGPQWSQDNDSRILPFGKLLRKSHLDEWPQLLNIIRGELSIVGPRPERPEFITELRKDIPYYDLRHLIRPGITGWAQINYRYGSSMEDSYEKLQYDMYYIKNRSVILDILTAIKTLRFLFTKAG